MEFKSPQGQGGERLFPSDTLRTGSGSELVPGPLDVEVLNSSPSHLTKLGLGSFINQMGK